MCDSCRMSYKGRTKRITPEILWSRIDRSPHPNGCWVYDGYRTKAGYGVIKWERKHWTVHRLIYCLSKGINSLPRQRLVCHTCDNPPCCNPDHMFVGTQSENLADMVAKGRNYVMIGTQHPRARLTDDIVRAAREWHRTEYKPGDPTNGLRAYARRMGVCNVTLGRAIHGKSWKHVPMVE